MDAVAAEGVWKFYGDYPALRDVMELLRAILPHQYLPSRNWSGVEELLSVGRLRARYALSNAGCER
jgi:hypothetical protein